MTVAQNITAFVSQDQLQEEANKIASMTLIEFEGTTYLFKDGSKLYYSRANGAFTVSLPCQKN